MALDLYMPANKPYGDASWSRVAGVLQKRRRFSSNTVDVSENRSSTSLHRNPQETGPIILEQGTISSPCLSLACLVLSLLSLAYGEIQGLEFTV